MSRDLAPMARLARRLKEDGDMAGARIAALMCGGVIARDGLSAEQAQAVLVDDDLRAFATEGAAMNLRCQEAAAPPAWTPRPGATQAVHTQPKD